MTSLSLGPVLCLGEYRVACIEARSRVRSGGYPAAWARLAPVAILLRDAAGIRAFDPDGQPMHLSDIEALLPGAVARFESATP